MQYIYNYFLTFTRYDDINDLAVVRLHFRPCGDFPVSASVRPTVSLRDIINAEHCPESPSVSDRQRFSMSVEHERGATVAADTDAR